MRYRRLQGYSVTDEISTGISGYQIFVSSPDVAIEISVRVLQLQRKMAKK